MPEGMSRRSFIKLAAVATTAAALPGCEPAARKLIPYVVPDENVTPGMPTYYASSCSECGAGCGIIATVREGRATTLAGNPANPISLGAICARGQAAVQGLYNPDRLRDPMRRTQNGRLVQISWDDAEQMLTKRLAAASKAGKDRVALMRAPDGPTFAKITKTFLGAYGSTQDIVYESVSVEAARNAAQTLFGRTDLPVYKLSEAETIISFDSDFLETAISPVEMGRGYAEFRTPKQRRGELSIGHAFYVGPRMNMTAAKCDDWVAVAPGAEAQVAWAVLHELVAQRWVSQNSGVDLDELTTMVSAYDPAAVSQRTGVSADLIRRMAQAFGKSDGAVALAAGDDESLHLAAYILNAVTGNIGRTMNFLAGPTPPPPASLNDLGGALTAMRDGKIDVLVINNVNPVFTMPPTLRAAESLQRVPFVVWMGTVPDETANMASLLLPTDHPLESWRDSAPRPGIRTLGQPVTQRIAESRPAGDLLLAAAAKVSTNLPWKTTADAVKAEWLALGPQNDTDAQTEFWTKVRREGGIYSNPTAAPVKLSTKGVKTPPPGDAASAELTFITFPHIFLYDGRGADKPWLQEIPDPVNQIVWDSWAEINPDTAKKLGIAKDELIELKTEHGVIEVPALVSKYVHPNAIAVPLGQGHQAYGRYANNRGANPWQIVAAGSMRITVAARGTGKSRRLITPLGKSDMMGRSIIEAMSLTDLQKGIVPPTGEQEAPKPWEMYPQYAYNVHKWGMTIDVNACTGCSACVAACYAENNLPVVGKELVDEGRIMSWMRIERFFPDTDENAPNIYVTPMLCQQCNHAPCEPVCPVFAAYHTQEGLNGQVYNRCVGTRYCENNCPYKVRRFNWYEPHWDEPLDLQLNPDVTVRGAGVMEKCTFCIQRIQHAEITARIENRPVRDGEIVTACEGACPTRAISFGDMNDKESAMMKRRDENSLRNYVMLGELNTQPAIVYLRDMYHEKGKA